MKSKELIGALFIGAMYFGCLLLADAPPWAAMLAFFVGSESSLTRFAVERRK